MSWRQPASSLVSVRTIIRMDTSPPWRPDLQQLWADLVPKLTPAKKRELCTLHQGLKDQRDAGRIPSLSAALWAEAPSCVGAYLWFLCVAKQRREPAAAQLPPLDRVPGDVLRIIARFAAAAKQTRDAPDGLLPLFLSHRRGRDVVDWQAALHDIGAGDLLRPRWGGSRDSEDDESSDESGDDEPYVKAHSRHVLMHTYFCLRRARILWQGERPMALECLCAGGIAGGRLMEGLRRVEPLHKSLSPDQCQVTGVDMRFCNSGLKCKKPRPGSVPWRRYHQAEFEYGGDRWDVRLERRRLMRRRFGYGISHFPDGFDDDDKLSITVQKLPFANCHPTCNCAHEFPLRIAVLGPPRGGKGGRWESEEWDAVPGCWFSAGVDESIFGEWRQAVDAAEKPDAAEPLRLLVMTPMA